MAVTETQSPPEVKNRTWGIINNVFIVAALIAAVYFAILRGKSWDQGVDNLIYAVKMVLGLGFLIFIHELGHFIAAKLCNVYVETFSIGFGPPIPGCHFKYGETEYKLAVFPIGGFVKMPGEYPSETQDEAIKKDPRTFMNQSVGERMFIISAGVIMNMLFGLVAFIVVYLHGKTERAPYFGPIEPGSPAFVAGIRAGSELEQVQDNKNPSYDDLFFASALSSPGTTEIVLRWKTPNGQEQEATVIPQRAKNDLRPVIGVGFPPGLRLHRLAEPDKSPATPGSVADNVAFRGNDLLTGIREKGAKEFKPLTNGWQYVLAEQELRGKTVEIQIDRNGKQMVFEVPPAFMRTYGLRMEMGPITSLAKEYSPAASKFQIGDVIIAFNGNVDFDPTRLPDLVTDQADLILAGKAGAGAKLELTVQRNGQKVVIPLDAKDFKGRGTWIENNMRSAVPLPIPALGIAYKIKPTIKSVAPGSPAAKAGLVVGQTLKEVKVLHISPDKPNEVERTEKLTVDEDNYQWPTLFWLLQIFPQPTWELTVTDAAGKDTTVRLTPEIDKTWPCPTRGLLLENQSRIRIAESVGEAIHLGWRDTYRFVGRIYVNLYSLVRGYLSPKLLSGPIDMVKITYNVASLSFWEYLHFLAIISINLAVVNFLPIPVLDGGHMVILIIEKIRGKPVSERILVVATIAGLCIVLALMVFTIFIDITKFEWFQRLFG